MKLISKTLQNNQLNHNNPLALLMFGSTERGNKLFRYNGWESLQFHQQLQSQTQIQSQANVFGMFSHGVFAKLNKPHSFPAIMDTNSMYVIVTAEPSVSSMDSSESISFSEKENNENNYIEDIMTSDEIIQFNDINDNVLVTKRDVNGVNSVRVASMDFFIPEKVPQPQNVLESIVWECEKEVDKTRERFQLARAITQVKAATAKFPYRNIHESLQLYNKNQNKLSDNNKLPILIELTKESLYGSSMTIDEIDSFVTNCEHQNVFGLGVNVETSIYKGRYEDIEKIKLQTNLPIVICNDFVVYAYQIFRAKSTGADSIKLLASILPIQEISYLYKITKVFNMTAIITVSSKPQLLDVLKHIPDVQAISVTGRNQKLWKVTNCFMKHFRIFSDSRFYLIDLI